MSTKEILAAIDRLPSKSKGRLMPKLRRKLQDFYDAQECVKAKETGRPLISQRVPRK